MGWIISALIEGISELIAMGLEAVTTGFLLSFDILFGQFNDEGKAIGIFDQFFPAAGTELQPMIHALAYGLFFVILMFQLAKGFLGPLSESEHPLALIGRSAIAFVGLVYSYHILVLVQMPLNAIYQEFAVIDIQEGMQAGWDFAKPEHWNELITDTVISAVAYVPISFLFLLAIGWAYIRLLLEVVERYIILGVLFYTAPLAFAMSGSASTRVVFANWIRMIGSQYVLMFMNIFFLKVFLSGLYNMPQVIGVNTFTKYFLWNLCVLAFLKIGQAVDQYMASLGLSTAQAGSSLAGAIAATVMTMGTAIKGGKFIGQQIREKFANNEAVLPRTSPTIAGLQGYNTGSNISGIGSTWDPKNVDTANTFFTPDNMQLANTDGTKFNIRNANHYEPEKGYVAAKFTGTDGMQYYAAAIGPNLGSIAEGFGGHEMEKYLYDVASTSPDFRYSKANYIDPVTGESTFTGVWNTVYPDGSAYQYSPKALYDVPIGMGSTVEHFGAGNFEWNRTPIENGSAAVIGTQRKIMDASFSQFQQIKAKSNQGAKFYNSVKRQSYSKKGKYNS